MRERAQAGEGQRERERENPKQTSLTVQGPHVGLKLMNHEIMA